MLRSKGIIIITRKLVIDCRDNGKWLGIINVLHILLCRLRIVENLNKLVVSSCVCQLNGQNKPVLSSNIFFSGRNSSFLRKKDIPGDLSKGVH